MNLFDKDFLTNKQYHLLACKIAENVLGFWTTELPNNNLLSFLLQLKNKHINRPLEYSNVPFAELAETLQVFCLNYPQGTKSGCQAINAGLAVVAAIDTISPGHIVAKRTAESAQDVLLYNTNNITYDAVLQQINDKYLNMAKKLNN